MSFWLLKSEPEEFSWNDMLSEGISTWDGVRNYQAQHNMKKMLYGELAFFYHSGKEKAIVGLVSIYKTFYYEQKNTKFGVVKVKALEKLNHIVTLRTIKSIISLQNMSMLKQPRLSVSEVTEAEWKTILIEGNKKII